MPDQTVSFGSFEDEVYAIFPNSGVEEDNQGQVIIYTGCEFQYDSDGAFIAGNMKFDNDEYVFGFAIGYFYGRTVGDLDMAKEEIIRRFSDEPHPAYIAGMNAGFTKGFALDADQSGSNYP